MGRGFGLILVVLAATLPTAAVATAETPDGAKLFKDNCVACHTSMVGGNGSSLFTRPNHRVKSFAGLGKQVRFCRDNLGLVWFDDQVDAVVDYLNATYYKFAK